MASAKISEGIASMRLVRPLTTIGIDEFVFVPARPDAAEDEGVLMGFVYDAGANRSALTVLDAATLEPVASVALPARVPHGFHGSWVPA